MNAWAGSLHSRNLSSRLFAFLMTPEFGQSDPLMPRPSSCASPAGRLPPELMTGALTQPGAFLEKTAPVKNVSVSFCPPWF